MVQAHCVVLTLIVAACATTVRPLEKVITLIEGLEKEAVDEGKAEGASYEKFACFCKETSEEKSKSIIKGTDNINTLSSDIADKTQEKKEDSTELGERKVNQESLSKELDDTNARCAKENAEYDAEAADMSKAVSSLTSAIKAMEDSRPAAASLLALQSVVRTLSASKAAKTSPSTKKAVAVLLQQKVDPDDSEFKFHSNDIIDLCAQLLTGFKDDKAELDTEWGKTSAACAATKKSLDEEMISNKRAMGNLEESIERLAKEIAEDREDLVQADGDLEDDQLYLKDLTARCEDRANDYDQRSQMRADELTALREALKILSNDVSDADVVNERALLMQTSKAEATADAKPISFLQGALVKEHAGNLLVKGRADAALKLEAKKNRAIAVLQDEGRRIGSVTIAAFTARAAADPFKKVKGLIQSLIERLLQESKNEATKKGFCDEAVGSAEHERKSRFQEANNLNRKIKGLEAKRDELTEEIDVLTKEISEEEHNLETSTEDREEEKNNNLKTLTTAKEGLEAVTNAIQVLKSFYSSAAKASAALIQASPVDEDTSGPGFSGSYKGKQGGMKAVFALLETIQSDFDRTIRTTEKAEEKAHRDFVEFSQTSKSSIAGKSTKKELDEQDLETTKTEIKRSFADMQSTMDLLDSALQELDKLKPTCIDTGMSYDERVQKREEEMAALGKALCILDTDGVEADCK